MAPEAIVGIDPSLTNTGIATVHAYGDVTLNLIKSKGTKEDDLDTRRKRINKLRIEILEVVRSAGDAKVCIESPAYSRTMGSMHDRSGLWWLIVDELHDMRYKVTEITPNQRAKYATGKGTAGKTEVVDAVARRWPEIQTGGNDNLADALVLAKMGANHYGVHKEKMPKGNMSVLDGVDWA